MKLVERMLRKVVPVDFDSVPVEVRSESLSWTDNYWRQCYKNRAILVSGLALMIFVGVLTEFYIFQVLELKHEVGNQIQHLQMLEAKVTKLENGRP
jgi:hypothetical protein